MEAGLDPELQEQLEKLPTVSLGDDVIENHRDDELDDMTFGSRQATMQYVIVTPWLSLMLLLVSLIASIYCTIYNTSQPKDSNSILGPLAVNFHGNSSWPYAIHLIAMITLCIGYVLIKLILMDIRGKSGFLLEERSIFVTDLGPDWSEEKLEEYLELKLQDGSPKKHVRQILASQDPEVEREAKNVFKEIEVLWVDYKNVGSKKCWKPWYLIPYFRPSKAHIETKTQMIEKLNTLHRKASTEVHPSKTGVAIVDFESQSDAEVFNSQWSGGIANRLWLCLRNKSDFQFNGHKIYAEEGAANEDIQWRNLKYRKCMKTLIETAALIVIFVTFVGFTALLVLSVNAIASINQSSMSWPEKWAISLPISIILQLTNSLITVIIRQFSKWEHHYSYSGEVRVVTWKITLFVILNSIVGPMYAFFHDSLTGANPLNNFVSSVFNNIVYFTFGKPVVAQISTVFNYKLKKWHLRKALEAGHYLTEEVCIEKYDYPEIDMVVWYSNLFAAFSISLFYTPFMPIIAPICMFGLIVHLVCFCMTAEKSSSGVSKLNDLIMRAMLRFMKLGIVLYSWGVFAMSRVTSNESPKLTYTALVIAHAFFFLPITFLTTCCRKRLRSSPIGHDEELARANSKSRNPRDDDTLKINDTGAQEQLLEDQV